MAAVTTFTWLHLTDMHVGQPKFDYDVALVIGKVLADVTALVDAVGEHLRPDAILFTGDLAYSGTEYFSTGTGAAEASVESLLTGLLNQWPWPSLPKLAPIPGNHDLAWQPFDLDQYVLWSSFHDASRIVRDQFFTVPTDAKQEPYWLAHKVKNAFAGYIKWLEQTTLPKVTADRVGRLPGEYATTFETKHGARVGLLALNTAYYDVPVTRKPRPRQLALHADQLTALGFADWYHRNNICLAMTHHPPSWIHELTRERLRQQYFIGDQIALHLCGHLHETKTDRYGSGWDDGTLIFQGRSLFGVEETAPGNVQPSLGYAIGQLRFTPDSEHAVLRMYPRQASFDAGGQFVFKGDGPVRVDHHLPDKLVRVRPVRSPVAAAVATAPPAAAPPRPRPSLEVLLEDVVDLVWRTLAEPSGQSVFLAGPPRYGKTTVVQVVRERLDHKTRIAHRDFSQLRDATRSVPREVTAFLLRGVAPLFGRSPKDFEDLGACLGACLDDARCVLVIDAYHLIAGSARQAIANELRHCMEAYRPRFRLLLLSRRPLVEVAPIPRTTLEPSSFQTMLREIELQSLGADAVDAWAAAHDRFRDRAALVAWLQRHTGGHPWLLSTLLQALCDLADPAWPAWTRNRSSDQERARGLHDATGPMSTAVRQLREGITALAPTLDAAKAPWLGLRLVNGGVIPFVSTCFGATR